MKAIRIHRHGKVEQLLYEAAPDPSLRDEFPRVLNFPEATGTKPVIDKVYPLAEAARAHQRLVEGQHFG